MKLKRGFVHEDRSESFVAVFKAVQVRNVSKLLTIFLLLCFPCHARAIPMPWFVWQLVCPSAWGCHAQAINAEATANFNVTFTNIFFQTPGYGYAATFSTCPNGAPVQNNAVISNDYFWVGYDHFSYELNGFNRIFTTVSKGSLTPAMITGVGNYTPAVTLYFPELCSPPPGGGGGGYFEQGQTYCSGSYEGRDLWYVDPEMGFYWFVETTWEYSVSCELHHRPYGGESDAKTSNEIDSFRSGTNRWRVVELDQPEWRLTLPLPAMFSQSKLVAVGEPVRNASRRSQDGVVTTNYDVKLIEVLKGNAIPGSTISVKMPGGWVNEDDGVILDARARRVRKMENGKIYIMFLANESGSGNSYSPLRGSQGLFESPRNGLRVRHLGRSFDLPPADDGELVSLFLQQLRDLSRNH